MADPATEPKVGSSNLSGRVSQKARSHRASVLFLLFVVMSRATAGNGVGQPSGTADETSSANQGSEKPICEERRQWDQRHPSAGATWLRMFSMT
jgi:hypothetical protein